FTYGTLMLDDVWLAVAGHPSPSRAARCHDFATYTVRGEVYPAMVPTPGEVVEGRVYFDVDPTALPSIDRFETDMYSRETVEVDCADGAAVSCHAYLLRAEFYDLLSTERWNIETYLRGGHHRRFAAQYLAAPQSPNP